MSEGYDPPDDGSQSIEFTFGGMDCYQVDPDEYPLAVDLANQYLCPLGCSPGIGYVLLIESDLENLDFSESQELLITAGETVSMPAMYVISAQKVSGGISGDPSAIYLVKFADPRWLAQLSDINAQYNVRCPAPPRDYSGPPGSEPDASEYYTGTINSDTSAPWTWEQMVKDIWLKMPTLGDWPEDGLPYDPDGTPDDFQFIGISALAALDAVLVRLECALNYDPVENTFEIVQLGEEQDELDGWQDDYEPYLLDADPLDNWVVMIPEKIRVYFRRRNEDYGTEPATTPDSGTAGNWATAAVVSVDTDTGQEGAIAGTILALWDDLPALAEFDATISNMDDLTTRATERTTNWVNNVQMSGGRFRTVYQGVAGDFRTGSQVKAVCWRWHGLDPRSGEDEGVVTEVACYPGLPAISDGPALEILYGGGQSRESLQPPDLARHSYPVYPPLLQLVTFGTPSASGGSSVTANGGGYYEGFVTRVDPTQDATTYDPFVQAERCWLLLSDYNGVYGASTTLSAGERCLARLVGTGYYSSGSPAGRPLYVLHSPRNGNARIIYGTLSGTLTAGGSVTCAVTQADDGTSPGSTVTVYTATGSYGFTGSSGAYFKAHYRPEDGKYYFDWVSC